MPAAATVVNVQLWRVPARRLGAALRLVATGDRAARRLPGATFAATLGTADGHTFRVRDATPRRWLVLSGWESADAAAGAAAGDGPGKRWAELAEEGWSATLRPLRAVGRWDGRQPFAVGGWRGAQATAGGAQATAGGADAPVAALTRATLRPTRAARFHRAVPAVAAALAGAPGLRLALGVGELPVLRLGTFSLWASAAAMTAFARDAPAHAAAARRAGAERWYAEELFARFAVTAAAGTIDGVDPLAGPPW